MLTPPLSAHHNEATAAIARIPTYPARPVDGARHRHPNTPCSQGSWHTPMARTCHRVNQSGPSGEFLPHPLDTFLPRSRPATGDRVAPRASTFSAVPKKTPGERGFPTAPAVRPPATAVTPGPSRAGARPRRPRAAPRDGRIRPPATRRARRRAAGMPGCRTVGRSGGRAVGRSGGRAVGRAGWPGPEGSTARDAGHSERAGGAGPRGSRGGGGLRHTGAAADRAGARGEPARRRPSRCARQPAQDGQRPR